jgi:hypothetical protein
VAVNDIARRVLRSPIIIGNHSGALIKKFRLAGPFRPMTAGGGRQAGFDFGAFQTEGARLRRIVAISSGELN